MITAPSMNPGRLDRRIALRYPVETRDAGGGVVTAWVQSALVWAQWSPQSGREIQQAGQKLALAVGTFRVRYRATIVATWRILFGSDVYELAAPPVEVGRREYMDLVVRALPAATASGSLQQVFEVALDAGDFSKAITWPTAFSALPASVVVSLIMPVDGETMYLAEVGADRTTLGTTVGLGAAVPGAGYKLSITVSQ